MTLDEAIAKAKADGDVQLAEWLRQARGADAAARWYTEKLRDADRTIRKLLDENTQLRELSSIMLKCIMAKECRKIICWECPMHKQFDELRSYCCLEHEAKELGIEVPE